MSVQIREYVPGDHDRVCEIFRQGLLDQIGKAFGRVLLGKEPRILVQYSVIVALFILYSPTAWITLLGIAWSLGVFSVSTFWCFYFYQRNHLRTDMKDPELKVWRQPGRSGFFVALEVGNDSRIVGMASYKIRRDFQQEKVAELGRMFVVPEAQGLGVGKALIVKIKDECNKLKVDKIVCDTFRQTGPHQFYVKRGFRYSKNVPLEALPAWTKIIHGIEVWQYSLELRKVN